MAKNVREQLQDVVQRGMAAEDALARLDLLDKAEGADADLDTIKQAVALAEGLGDFQTSARLKSRQLRVLRKLAR